MEGALDGEHEKNWRDDKTLELLELERRAQRRREAGISFCLEWPPALLLDTAIYLMRTCKGRRGRCRRERRARVSRCEIHFIRVGGSTRFL